MTLYAVIRPDGSVIPSDPGTCREFALWNARALDERLARIVQRNRTNNVTMARRAGYGFEEVSETGTQPQP